MNNKLEKKVIYNIKAYFSYFIIVGLLISCGGGTNNSIPPPTAVEGSSLVAKKSANGMNIYYPDQFFSGQAASFAVTKNDDIELVNIQWRQISGPDLVFLAPHTQVIGFDIESTGEYQIELLATTSNNEAISEIFTFSALPSQNDKTSIRLDHAVSAEANVSLSVETPDKTIDQVTWKQTSGLQVTDMEVQQGNLYFTAPSVNADSILQFEAQVNYSDGTSASDNSFVVVKKTVINRDGFFPKFSRTIVTTDVFPYESNGPYSNVLVDCVYNNEIDQSCPFQRLPLLGQEHSSPAIEDVLDRLIVSHSWMGDRFKQFLQESSTSQDMLTLLRATTAIVISYDVRPSFYWTASGAIYLDAANFWVSPQERDTLNTRADFRSNFGDELQFIIPWRYVKNNDYYYRSSNYPEASRLTRSFNDLEASVSWLMYHELGHANDFFPSRAWASIDSQTSPLAYSNNFPPASEQFGQTYGLNSDIMAELAQVSFAGTSATSNQKNLTSDDIASYFSTDIAPAYYSYFTNQEDYATLFERFMMAYRLGASSDVAVISQVDNDDFIVTWGQRDRINLPQIQTRVRKVVSDILPELDVENIQQNLPEPLLMTPNVDWFSNISLGQSIQRTRTDASRKPLKPEELQDYWLHHQIRPRVH